MTRERVMEVIKEMPPDFDLDALFERLVFIEKVEEGLKEDDNDETVSSDDIKKMIDEW